MTNPEQITTAQESSQRTYDRRRARAAAETLANIPPNRWDDTTKRMIATLATIAAPSRIDDALEVFDQDAHDGPGADTMIEIHGQWATRENPHDMPAPTRWEDMPEGTEDIREAFAAELHRMGLDHDPERPREGKCCVCEQWNTLTTAGMLATHMTGRAIHEVCYGSGTAPTDAR